jgi:hypothetical protein
MTPATSCAMSTGSLSKRGSKPRKRQPWKRSPRTRSTPTRGASRPAQRTSASSASLSEWASLIVRIPSARRSVDGALSSDTCCARTAAASSSPTTRTWWVTSSWRRVENVSRARWSCSSRVTGDLRIMRSPVHLSQGAKAHNPKWLNHLTHMIRGRTIELNSRALRTSERLPTVGAIRLRRG